MIDVELRNLAIDTELAASEVVKKAVAVRDNKPGDDLDVWHSVLESLTNLARQTEALRQGVREVLGSEQGEDECWLAVRHALDDSEDYEPHRRGASW
jgi:hypothetical protein